MSYPSRNRIADEVRAEMARQQVTPAELATATGISRATLGRRLSGRLPFTIDELGLIATHLHVDPSRFVALALDAQADEETVK